MAEVLNINVRTLGNWMDKHPEFSKAIKSGMRQADGEVAERLFSRATGHSHEAVKIFMPAGAEAPVYARYVKHYPPDTNAALAWLSRRQPELWKERQQVDFSGTLEHRLSQMTPQERAEDAIELVTRARRRVAEYRQTIEHESEE